MIELKKWKQVAACFLYGNYFYGLLLVTTSIETCIVLGVAVPDIAYISITFLAATFFYTEAYIYEDLSLPLNARSEWYKHHRAQIEHRQTIFLVIIAFLSLYKLIYCYNYLAKIPVIEYICVMIIPIIASLYYGSEKYGFNLRKYGILKPFLIGFVWSGAACYLPYWYVSVCTNKMMVFDGLFIAWISSFFAYMTLLAVLFDVKDVVSDRGEALKTFMVRLGYPQLIYKIVVPLGLCAWGGTIYVAYLKNIGLTAIIILSMVYFLTIFSSFLLYKPRSILFYLSVIDGMLLLKSILGIILFYR